MPREASPPPAPVRYAVRGPALGRDLAADPRVNVDHVRAGRAGRPQSAEAYLRAADLPAVRAAHPAVTFEAGRAAPGAAPAGYTSNEQLGRCLQALAARFPAQVRVLSLGSSARGVPLWAAELAADLRGADPGYPVVRFVGNVHGDETLGRELLLRLAAELAETFAADPAGHPLAAVRVHLLPCLNPDGFAAGSRFNARGADLNRDFPDGGASAGAVPQPETAAARRWIEATGARCVLSASLHGGALVASYPYDRVRAAQARLFDPSPYAAAPDDALLRHLAKAYARAHGRMAEQGGFPDGVTNGSDWYQLAGGLQDWEYDTFGTLSLTLELSAAKSPPAAELPGFWAENRAPLYGLLRAAAPLTQLRGWVVDAATGAPVPGASVRVPGQRPRPATAAGRFFVPRLADARPAARLLCEAPGYRARVVAATRETLERVELVPLRWSDRTGCTRFRVLAGLAVAFLLVWG